MENNYAQHKQKKNREENLEEEYEIFKKKNKMKPVDLNRMMKVPPQNINMIPQQKYFDMNMQFYHPTGGECCDRIDPTYSNLGVNYSPYVADNIGYFPENIRIPLIKNIANKLNYPVFNKSPLLLIHEDSLPCKDATLIFVTIEERIFIHLFIKNTLIRMMDNSVVSFENLRQMSFMTHIKIENINPYNLKRNHLYSININEYIELPDNMLIYRAKYPIVFNTTKHLIDSNINSMELNMKIYNITEQEYTLIIKNPEEKLHVEAMREMEYYVHIYNEIIKNKVCPHFVISHTYFMCEDYDHNFMDSNIKKQIKTSQEYLRDYMKKIEDMNIQNNNIVSKNSYTSRCIISLTESPTYNFIDWASHSYDVYGNILKLNKIGHHRNKVWYSILFQLLAALYILFKKQITFNKFTFKENVFIKALSQNDIKYKCWVYIIGGIKYYVPNYGYVVMIDTNYKDIEDYPMGSKIDLHHKIYSQFMGDTMTDPIIKKKSEDQILNTFNIDIFSDQNGFMLNNGIKPSPEVLNLINNIHNTFISSPITEDNFRNNFYINMNMFLNNRLGTYLTQEEMRNVNMINISPLEPGKLYAYEENINSFYFVIYKKPSGLPHVVDVITKNALIMQLPRASLKEYMDSNIMQYQNSELLLGDNDILETYDLDK